MTRSTLTIAGGKSQQMILTVVHQGSFTGGFGTGSGRAGAIVALVLGLIGVNLGGLALARSRRSRSD